MRRIENTYNRIIAYLKGLLSDRDRHELEKEMMHDVFEEEAFEGLTQLSADELDSDMKVLMNRLEINITRTKKLKPWFYFRLAAGVIFLIGIGSILYLVLFKPSDDLLIAKKEVAVSETLAPPPPAKMDTNIEGFKTDFRRIDEEEQEIMPVIVKNHTDAIAESSEDHSATLDKKPMTEEYAPPIEPLAAENLDVPVKMKNETLSADEIIILAVESIAEPDHQADKQLQGRAAGVSVSQKSAEKRDMAEKRDTTEFYNLINPVPPGGTLKIFKKWVTDRLDYSLFRPYPGKQRILVSLSVHENGKISDIRIKETVPVAMADEIKRVISESPLWKPAYRDGAPVETRVALRFILTTP